MGFEQRPFELAEFAMNPDPRCPCVLLLDVSGSMAGDSIQQLSEGYTAFLDALRLDPVAARRVEIAVISFGPVRVDSDFELVEELPEVQLGVGGDTPMGAAIEQALDLIENRKRHYRTAGVPYYRPWIFLITDGAPTDAWQAAATRLQLSENAKKVAFFAVGVDKADLSILSQISVRAPLRLRGLQFRDLFVWLSSSLSSISKSRIDDEIRLDDPTGPRGWAMI